jgi:hypothetical protein
LRTVHDDGLLDLSPRGIFGWRKDRDCAQRWRCNASAGELSVDYLRLLDGSPRQVLWRHDDYWLAERLRGHTAGWWRASEEDRLLEGSPGKFVGWRGSKNPDRWKHDLRHAGIAGVLEADEH